MVMTLKNLVHWLVRSVCLVCERRYFEERLMNNNIYKLCGMCLIVFWCAAYVHYATQVLQGIKVEGYAPFSYAIWLHPHQLNKIDSYFNKASLDNIKSFLKSDGVIIDIGAHTGDNSVQYAVAMENNGKVIAFEPNPAVFEVLKLNAACHPSIVPVQKAVMDHDGTFTFNYGDAGLCNGGNEAYNFAPASIRVEGINLEQWLLKNYSDLIHKICFIKIDTEGSDFLILSSIRKLIMAIKPVLQFESFLYLSENDRLDLFRLVTELGYKCYFGEISAYNRAFMGGDFVTGEQFVKRVGCDIVAIPVITKQLTDGSDYVGLLSFGEALGNLGSA